MAPSVPLDPRLKTAGICNNLLMDLFDDGNAPKALPPPNTPLAARMRPRTLEEFVGQAQIVGSDTLLRRAIEEDALTSVIFFGPPGVGKSTLAGIIANTTKAHFENFSAVTQGIPDLRKVIEAAATRRKLYGSKTVLFIDEIHRFNKTQQDALLPHVENGTAVLIGATTENPYFEVNAPLLSRARVFTFTSLSDEQIGALLDRAVSDEERGLGNLRVVLEPDARAHLIDKANGDARTALNALELAATTTRPESRKADAVRRITRIVAEEALQQRALTYDKTGDTHYDTISAFIKSIRGSDPDAGLYYLARMLTAGEDARFIARRLVILASEERRQRRPDGTADRQRGGSRRRVRRPARSAVKLSPGRHLPGHRSQVQSLLQRPQARPGRRADGKNNPVPKHLRDARSGTGRPEKGDTSYLNPHEHAGGFVAQQYLPEGVQTQIYYEPTDHGFEAKVKALMAERILPRRAPHPSLTTGMGA